MKYQKRCNHCDSVVTAYTHNINKPMLLGLKQMAIEYLENNREPVNINSLDLDHNQKCNVPKLQYYGLIQKVEEGRWIITNKGLSFCMGKTSVLSPAATLGNKVLPNDHEAWETHTKARELKTIYDIIGWEYKKAEEYKDEKRVQQKLI